MPILLLVLAATVAATYLSIAGRQRKRVLHDPLIYLYTALAFFSVTVSLDPMHSFLRALRLLPLVGFGVLYAQAFDRRKMMELMTLAFLVSASFSILMSVAFPAYGGSHLEGAYDSAWRGALEHKNGAGALYGLGVIFAAHALISREVQARLAIPALATCALMLIKAQSATSITAAIVALPAYAFLLMLRRVRPEYRLLILTVTLISIGTLAFVLNEYPELVVGAAGRDSTLTGRTDIWAAVWQEIQQQPFRGHGYSFWTIESGPRERIGQLVGYAPAHSHNDWLEIWLQIGAGGIVLIALEYLWCFARGLGFVLTGRGQGVELLFAMLLYLLMRSFTEVQMIDPGPGVVFWIVWIAMRLKEQSRTANCATVNVVGTAMSAPQIQA